MKRKAPSDLSLTQSTPLDFCGPAKSGQKFRPETNEYAKTNIAMEAPGPFDDVIEDDYDSFDEIFTQHFADDGTCLREDITNVANDREGVRPFHQKELPYSQSSNTTKRFVIPPVCYSQPRLSRPFNADHADLPWAQRFPPKDISELAVHSRKISDVKTWLNNAFHGTGERLLILRGPSGSGKTTTVSILSETLGFEIIEWRNPAASDSVTNLPNSVALQFGDFLERANELPGLDLDLPSNFSEGQRGAIEGFSPRRRLILIEEFPSLITQSSNLSLFRMAVQRYLVTAGSAREMDIVPCSPMVIIISETLLDSCSSFSDNITAHRLLGPAICNHPGTRIIDFNSIAPTFMFRALNLILEKEGRVSKSERALSPATMRSLSQNGDIRSAAARLEFICLKSSNFAEMKKPSKAKKASRRAPTLTPVEEQALGLITQRETTLGLFHAVGKVVYNKRDDPSSKKDGQPVMPPSYLRHYGRPKISQVQVNELYNETGTDTQTFISTLHENYVPSCDGASFTECLDDCISALSDSDLLYPISKRTNRFFIHATRNSAAVETLRQQEISYQVAARGLLFALPYPVSRKIPFNDGIGTPRHSQQLLYPTSLRSLHIMEEVEGLVALWSSRLLSSISYPAPGSIVESTTPLSEKELGTSNNFIHEGARNVSQTVTATMIPRSDLILHQLPYMACLLRGASEGQELEKITKLTRLQPQASNKARTFFGELGTPGPNVGLLGEIPKTRIRGWDNTLESHLPSVTDERELTLSDDEIIDDN
ncbi:putative cell cycle checkpoint protein Rad17 [Aspergillus aculeatinus CBS 121060]|uniref:Cell cycle checkpoint protein rad17 n=1 Tax=Aspergillus aculeatinus CBS 121060 TaxID=1448322 RepID=A0ACD1HBK2_9EURO|nr:cell cycle checkpoint protein rad17 [Aspergillus aculeatinus CBS 121060]RAH71045.1 cell cycle checkpoint protein rad17 [Aspergillus aculeatinus CBS 121060]